MIPATSNHHTQQNTTTNDELEVPKWLALQNTKHTATSSRGLIISANKHDTTMDSSEYSMDACVWMHKQARIKHARAVHRKQDGALFCHLMFCLLFLIFFFSFQCAPLECSFGDPSALREGCICTLGRGASKDPQRSMERCDP